MLLESSQTFPELDFQLISVKNINVCKISLTTISMEKIIEYMQPNN